MSCDRIQDLLTAYLDDELSTHERSLVSTHLEQCSECRELYNHLSYITIHLSESMLQAEPPESIRKNVLEAINEEPTSKTVNTGWQWRRVAAALVLFFLSISTGLYPLLERELSANLPQVRSLEDENLILRANHTNESDNDSGLPSELSKGFSLQSENSLDTEGTEKSIVKDDEAHNLLTEDDSKFAHSVQVTNESGREVAQINVQDDPKHDSWLNVISTERVLFSVTGIFFSLLMLWCARPHRRN